MFGLGEAIKHLKDGGFVSREGWNGKQQFLGLQIPDVGSKNTLPYIYIFTEQGQQVPWTCSQTDLLALDWKPVSDVEV